MSPLMCLAVSHGLDFTPWFAQSTCPASGRNPCAISFAISIYGTIPSWSADWAWGLPMVVLTVVIHVLCLGLLYQRAIHLAGDNRHHRHPVVWFVLLMGATTLFATCLHAMEVALWAAAYVILGALPDYRSAILYSLSAVTSYGNANLDLEAHWKLMGAIESLNGWLLFGLTTAFLFGMIDKVWLLSSGENPRLALFTNPRLKRSRTDGP
jgi:hypothetical protein